MAAISSTLLFLLLDRLFALLVVNLSSIVIIGISILFSISFIKLFIISVCFVFLPDKPIGSPISSNSIFSSEIMSNISDITKLFPLFFII